MRDVGILIWVALLVIGVIGSMVSSLRKAASAQPQLKPTAPSQWRPQRAAPEPRDARLPDWAQQIAAAMPKPQAQPPPRPAPAPPPPKPAPRAAPAPAEHEAQAHQPRRRSFFGDRSDIVRAVIAAEVLGKPRGLNDEYLGR